MPPSRAPFAAAVAAALVGFPAAAAFADDETPRFGDVLDVPLVEVEVLATDRDGRPVTDLARDEFRLFEDDRPVAITHFQPVAGAPAAAGAAVDDEESLHLAVFVDEIHVGAASRRQLLHQLAGVLGERLRPEDRVLVVAYDGTTRVVLPFSRDRRALRAALSETESMSVARLVVEQERTAAMQDILLDAKGGHGWSPCLHIAEFVDSYAMREFARVRDAVAAFRGFVDSLSGIAGRKAVIHVSDGIPLRAGAEGADYALELCGGSGAAQAQTGATEVHAFDIFGPQHRTLDMTRYDATSLWRDVAARANAGNVSLYAVQAGEILGAVLSDAGLAEGGPTAGAKASALANHQETLFLLADETGGRALFGRGDVRAALAGAVDELRRHYELAYSPPAARDGRVRRVRVEVDRPGVELRYRRLYRARTLDEEVSEQLVGRLLYGGEAAATEGLDFTLREAIPDPSTRVRARFRLRVPFDELTLLERDGRREGLFSVFLAVADGSERVSGVRKREVPITLPAAAEEGSREFVWEVEMLVRPEPLRFGLAVRDEVGGRTHFLQRNFDLERGR
jgi:VWFA-related protein